MLNEFIWNYQEKITLLKTNVKKKSQIRERY